MNAAGGVIVRNSPPSLLSSGSRLCKFSRREKGTDTEEDGAGKDTRSSEAAAAVVVGVTSSAALISMFKRSSSLVLWWALWLMVCDNILALKSAAARVAIGKAVCKMFE